MQCNHHNKSVKLRTTAKFCFAVGWTKEKPIFDSKNTKKYWLPSKGYTQQKGKKNEGDRKQQSLVTLIDQSLVVHKSCTCTEPENWPRRQVARDGELEGSYRVQFIWMMKQQDAPNQASTKQDELVNSDRTFCVQYSRFLFVWSTKYSTLKLTSSV